MQKDLPFYKHVVQIEFNAWNYSGGNLWASLVQHILENLEIAKDEPPDLLAERQKVLQNQMQLERQVRDNAEKKAAEAQKKVNETEAELRVLRVRHENRVKELKNTLATDVLATFKLDDPSVEKLNKLRDDLSLPRVSATAGEFIGAIDGTRAALLDVTAEELHYIERLAPLLERSPRALKRFANVYRLLKASLPPEEQDVFLDQSTDPAAFKAVVLLLAIVNGLPAASQVMFGRRLNGQPADPKAQSGTLGALLSVALGDGEAAIEESGRLSKWLTTEFGEDWSARNASAFTDWLPRVARYSYHLPR